jgi:hypothetical protein
VDAFERLIKAKKRSAQRALHTAKSHHKANRGTEGFSTPEALRSCDWAPFKPQLTHPKAKENNMNGRKKRMTQDLELAGYADRTRSIYLHAIADFAAYRGWSPSTWVKNTCACGSAI